MIHDTRVYSVRVVSSAEELAELLTEFAWTLCTGFEYSGLVVLNDSFSEDGAQEWAVFRHSQRVESVTFSWCSKERALEILHALLAGAGAEPLGSLPRTEPAAQHGHCHLCE